MTTDVRDLIAGVLAGCPDKDHLDTADAILATLAARPWIHVELFHHLGYNTRRLDESLVLFPRGDDA